MMKKFIQQNKVHVIIWAIGILVFGFYLYNQLTAPSYLLHGFLLNTETAGEGKAVENMTQEFVREYKVDLDRGDVLLDDSYICEPGNDKLAKETSDTIHQIFIGQGEQTLDFILGPSDVLKNAIYESCAGGMSIFADLSTTLTDAQIKLYKPHFLYVDQAVIDELAKAYEKKEDVSSIKLPDMKDPKAMENPIPIMIDVSNSEKLSDIYGKKANDLSFVLMADSPSQALAMNFLEYITLEEK